MEAKSQRQKRRDDALPLLNEAIDALNLARETTSTKTAKEVFTAASALLITTRVGSLPARFADY